MKKVKKWCSLLMVAAMLLSLAACASSAPPAASSQPAASANQGGAASSAPAAQGGEAKTYDKKLTIQFANVGVLEGYDFTNGDAYAKFWADKFNWEIDMVGMSWDKWNEMLRIWINSRDMPDVAVFNYNATTHPDAAAFAEQGLVKKMPDDWRQRWPNVARVFDKTTLGPQMEEQFDGVYYLPRARFDTKLPGDPLPNHMSLHMRRDWAEAVGFPIKDAYTIPEILEYARLIKEQDPGGLGSSLIPIAVRPDMATMMFVGHNSTYYNNFYLGEDGSYKWGAASEDTLEGLQLMYEAFSTGLLHPEFYTLKADEDNDMFRITAVAGATYMGGVATGLQVDEVARFEASTGLDSTKAVSVVNVLGTDGKYHQQDLINFWGAIVFSPTIEDEKFERYMDALDFGCTDEGYRIQTAGFEGEDYEIVDGKMVSLLPEGMPLESSEGKYPSIGGYNLANMKLWDDFSFETPVVSEFYRQRSWDLYKNRVEMGTPETFTNVDWTVYCHDSPSRRKTSYVYATEYVNIVTNSKSKEDVEKNWRAWIDSQMPLVQPVLDELDAKR